MLIKPSSNYKPDFLMQYKKYLHFFIWTHVSLVKSGIHFYRMAKKKIIFRPTDKLEISF